MTHTSDVNHTPKSQLHDMPGNHIRRIRYYGLVTMAFWTLVIGCSFAWFYSLHTKDIAEIARVEALAAFERDMLFRQWGSRHGGVYVPVSELSPPNPYLSHVPERDITTPSGRKLTLVNPAYMLRQMYEMAAENTLLGRGHITSLNPLRPENRPDPWEEQGLHAFEAGAREVSGLQTIDGRRYQRVMRPFVTEKSCLKCHAIQGYREGDVRGGISVSMPLRSLQEATRHQVFGEGVAHGLLWLFGVSVIGIGTRRLARSAGALQESEVRYRTVADFTSDWEYWLAPDGSLNYVSPSSAEVCSYSADELYRDPDLLVRMIHPEDFSRYHGHLHAIDDSGNPVPIDFRIITRDGRERWVSHVCREIVGADGRTLGRRASNRDITDRIRSEIALREQTVMLEEEMAERQSVQESLQVQAAMLEEEVAEREQIEAELKKQEAYLRTIVETEPECVKLLDAEGRLLMMNRAGLDMIEAESLPQVGGQCVYPLVAPEFREAFMQLVDRVFHGESGTLEFEMVGLAGRRLWLDTHAVPLRDETGAITALLAITRDVTQRKRAEAAVTEYHRQLEELNESLEVRVETALAELRQKDQLLIQQSRLAGMGEMINNIAHQWRQPLNNVGLIIQNLQISHEAGTLQVQEMRSEVEKAMDMIMHMSQTIDDFRNFFRQDKERHTFVVNKVVRRVINFVKTSLESSDIRIQLEESEQVNVTGFQNEYAQALINVVSNARDALLEREVPAPRILIRVAQINGRSQVTVRDNAGGIDTAILPRVFDPYFTTKPPGKGTGIGLYMSKVIIEQHMGGTLSAGNVEEGAEFTLNV